MIGAAGLVAALLISIDCPHVSPPADPQLQSAWTALREAYLQAGLCPPIEDATLSKAALALAAGPGSGLPDPVGLQRTVQEAGGGDPAPRAMLITGSDSRMVARDLDQQWRPQPGDQVAGLAVVARSSGVRLAVLTAERKVAVDPLPVQVATGSVIAIQGTLLTDLRSPSVYVEGPNGRVARLVPSRSDARFRAEFSAVAPGRYAIEVLAQGARGPEVLFLKSVAVGIAPSAREEAPVQAGTRDDPAAVLEQINRERQRYGAPALATDPRLDQVAQGYARELRELGLFAHVSPRSGNLKDRLHRAGYKFRSAAENLAEGPTALEAQALTANSPAHRQAMLDPKYTRCGLGLSRALSGEGKADVLLVEVFVLDGSDGP